MRLSGLIIVFFHGDLFSQNLEKIGKKNMVTVSGGMNYNEIFYNAYGMNPRRDPYTWYFNGNLNVNILDVSLPFTYSYTNNRGTYTQPFNMQSCSPKYKWAQAHVGTTAMNFSNYTLSGHIFTGAGIELTPNGFYIGAMYGRLNKAIAYDAVNNSAEGMSYKRNGAAFKVGYDNNGHSIGLTYFTAKDDLNSLNFIPADANLFAQQNAAVSVNGKTKLFSKLSLEGEYALSGITANIKSNNETVDFSGWEKWMMPTKTTTKFFKAYRASLTWTEKIFSLSIKHEHVDPDYRTFGSYYFINDLDNWSLAPSLRLFNGKINLNINSGLQRNNLDGSKINTMYRWVASANLNVVLMKSLVANASYSNFTSYTTKRPVTDPFWTPSPADTLNFYQVNEQWNSCLSYSFGKEKFKNSVSLMGAYVLTQQKQLIPETPATGVLNVNTSYSLQFVPAKFSVSISGNYNQSKTDTILTEYLGPGIQLIQNFLQGKMHFSAGTVFNEAKTNAVLTSEILSHRAQFSFSPKMKEKKYGQPTISVNAIFLQKFPVNTSQHSTGELTLTANLGYTF
ncbi:MAG: hypothetical protein HY064_07375 [Bacteroidetes bacterium]|nr:hypothetical protein [Bacteroidota bacterium]